MRRDKQKALDLRLKGLSYNEISQRLGISKSTLSGWFSGLSLSTRAQNRIKKRVAEGSLRGLIKKNLKQTHEARKRATVIRKNAARQIKKISKKELRLLGTAIYWGEGYKKSVVKNGKERTFHVISLSNSDPVMIRLFIKFLKDILDVPHEKIRANVRIFEHLNEKKTLHYWQIVTGLPKKSFRKFYYGISKSSLGKRPYNRLPYGTIQIVVGDTKNFYKIMGWIDGIKKSFQQK